MPDELHEGASVLILGQNPGAEEEAEGRPFVGATGQKMEREYLSKIGLSRADVSVGNALRCRWRNSNALPPITQTITKDAIRHCTQAHFTLPESTKLIVTQGDYAALAFTGEPIGEWRGYLRPCTTALTPAPVSSEPWVPDASSLPVLVTVHLASFHYGDPTLILPTRLDWAKVPKILRYVWPRHPPRFVTRSPETWPEAFAFDTEFWGEWPNQRLVRYSMSWGVNDEETCVVEAVGWRYLNLPKNYRPRIVTQYAPADVHWLEKLSRSRNVWQDFLIEDTIWKHAVLWSDHAHDLNYLGSLYSSFNRWKHLSDRDPTLYSGLDAVGLWEVDSALERELSIDPRSRSVWESIDRPVLGEFVRAQYAGLRVNQTRLDEAIAQLSKEVIQAQEKAHSITGMSTVNIGSNAHVAHRLYTVEGTPPPRAKR